MELTVLLIALCVLVFLLWKKPWDIAQGKIDELSEKAKKSSVNPKLILVGIIVFIFILLAFFGGGSTSTHSKTCPICHREFSNPDDLKSLRWNNMCELCYKNYEYGQKMRGN